MARHIDADKVMEEIASMGGHGLCEWSTLGVKALIERQPTADVAPRAEWISIAERLPSSEDLERSQFHNFLVANEFGEVREAVFTGKYFAKLGSRLSGVTHWMPLPDPPTMKEVDEDD